MTWSRASAGFGVAAAGGAFVALAAGATFVGAAFVGAMFAGAALVSVAVVAAVGGVAATVFPLPPLGAGVAAAVVAGAAAVRGASGAGLSTRRRQRVSI